jgi:very-short-patch-repair endonuclease
MQWNTLQAELAKQPLLCAYVSAYQNTPQLEPKKETPTPEGLAPAFEALYFQQLIDFMEQSQPELRSFQADSHEGLRQQFKQQDQAITQATQQALIERLRTQVRKGMSELEQTPRTFLQGQIKATRGRRSLRTLLRMGAKGVRTLKPCFMMSPLSVTEFIDPTLYQFDIIIFDEASQVRPEEALGAIVRGKQLVVVGDSKQLPPTSFFGGSGSSEHSFDDVEEDLTEEELALISEEESILDQCLKSGFPSHTLRWHYRSRHESLITFSNRYLYDNNLLSFPSPEAEHEVMGLHFEQVPDGVYLGKGKNLREAERIVEAVVAHAHQRPNRTLGVATFGASQKTVIDELLDNRRLQDSQLDAFLRSHGDEGFFVKNLENVQGDERDLIFISVTYGPQANGKFVYNFGPINSEGGKRRLNVIATRARLGTRLFASFHPDQLRAESLNSEGARLLKAYLSFAAGGQLETATVNAIDAFDSAFEEAVAEALRLNGYEVRTQVGQSGYRIDLGVLDPACPGRFLAGVECDGATYHSSATARDRDRLRQQVLEGLGWTILRVWSTDWFREPEAALARLLSQLEAAKEALAQPTEATSLALPQTHEPTLELPLTDADKQLLQGQLPPLPAYRCVPNPSQLLGEAKAFPTVANLQLQLLILAILAIEAPICLDELTRRVVAHWGMLRISDRSRFKVDEVLNWMQNSGQPITYSQGFVWLTQQTIIARDRSQLSPLPKPESIAGNELAACIQHVLTYRGVLMADALVRECSRCLGYGRLSAQFTNQLHDVVDSLCQTGQLVHVSTGLQWVSVEASTSNTHDPNKVFV